MLYRFYFKISILINQIFYIIPICLQKFKKDKHKLIAIYDLRQNGLSYNFFQFLIGAEMHRSQYGFKKVELYVINKHRKEKYRWSLFYDSFKKKTIEERTFNLLPELSGLFPNFSDIKIIDKREFEFLAIRKAYFPITLFPRLPSTYNHLIDLKKLINSKLIPEFFPNNKNCYLEKILINWLTENNYCSFFTYTIRNSKFDKNRNSNVQYLPKLKKWLQTLNIGLIIIPDSENNNLKNNNDSKAYKIGSLCSKDVSDRLYIYQKSNLNIFVPNGPSILCTYSKKTPFILLNAWPQNSIVKQESTWFNPKTMVTYWSDTEFQKLTYYQDNLEDVKSAILDLIRVN